MHMGLEGMRGDGHEGGTHRKDHPPGGNKCWGYQQGMAGNVMGSRSYNGQEMEMCHAARRLNLKHLKLIDDNKCPFADFEAKGCNI